ncbi:MAG: alpha/beta fold hydrolase [Nannocystaceae bacterium]|nr:alpha/beta fold hydrolase [Nannocystaceae bacterium]
MSALGLEPGAPWLPADVVDDSRLLELSFGRVFVCDVHPPVADVRKPPLVLLHGLFLTHHAFSRVIPQLAVDRRVVALDLPGAGDSDRPSAAVVDEYSFEWLADAVAETLEALGVSACTLVGHDFGGTLALVLAAKQPDRVRDLFLLAPLALTVSLPLQGALAIAPSLGLEVFRRTLRRADLVRFLEQGLSTPELLDEGEAHVFWDRLSRWGGREAAYAMLTQMPSVVRLRDRFAAVAVPTTLIWGDRDQIVPPDHATRLAALLPDASEEIIDGCGHNPAYERPNELAKLLGAPA